MVWMGVTMYNQDAAMSILDSPSQFPMPNLRNLDSVLGIPSGEGGASSP